MTDLKRRSSIALLKASTPAKDVDKEIQIIHPSTRRGLKTVFDERQKDGKITGEQFFDMMAQVQEVQDIEGINYSVNLMTKFITADNEELDFNDVLLTVAKFILEARKHSSRMSEKKSKTKNDTDKFLETWDYLQYFFCPSKFDRSIKYRWKGITSIDPKTSLRLIVVIVCIFMSLVTVSVLTAENSMVEVDQVRETVEMHTTVYSTTIESIERQVEKQAVTTMGWYAEDVGRPISDTLRTMAQHLVRLIEMGMRNLRVILHSSAVTMIAKESDALTEVARTFDYSARQIDLSVPELANLVEAHTMQYPEYDAVIITRDSVTNQVAVRLNTFASPSKYPGCALCSNTAFLEASACIQKVHNASAESTDYYTTTNGMKHAATTIISEESSPVNSPVLSAGIVTVHGAIMCIYGNLTRTRMLFRQHVQDIVRNLSSVQSYGVGNATWPADLRAEVALFEGSTMYAATSMDYIASSVSPLPSDFMRRAISEVRTNMAKGDSASQAGQIHHSAFQGVKVSGGYASIELEQMGFDVLVTASRSDEWLQTYFVQGLPPYLVNKNSPITPSLIVRHGNATYVSYTVLGTSMQRDIAKSPHIVLGLNGFSGALVAHNENNELCIAGYAHISDFDAAVIFELPRRYIHDEIAQIRELIAKSEGNDAQLTEVYIATRDNDGNIKFLTATVSPQSVPALSQLILRCFALKETYLRDDSVDDRTAGCSYLPTTDVVVVTAIRNSHLRNRMWTIAGWSILVAAVLTLLFLILIRLLTLHVLDHIEQDYILYKQKIEEEKLQFSELIKDVMPQYISERIINGEKLIVDQHSQLTFFFSDIVSFTEVSRKMSTVEMVRVLAYTFMTEDGVAEFFNITKIKTIGDAYFCVAGLEDLSLKQTDPDSEVMKGEKNQLFRMVAFAAVVQMLVSSNYLHEPERTQCFKEWSGDKVGGLKLLPMRMGIHTGPAIAGVVDVGRSPHFDCFGPSVNLASRMESTSSPNRIQLSTPTYQLLQRIDKSHVFEFEAPKKTLVKGYGTISTYLLKSTTFAVPDAIMETLNIERAIKRMYFNETGLNINVGQESTMMDSENKSQSLHSIERESVSKHDGDSHHGTGSHQGTVGVPSAILDHGQRKRSEQRSEDMDVETGSEMSDSAQMENIELFAPDVTTADGGGFLPPLGGTGGNFGGDGGTPALFMPPPTM